MKTITDININGNLHEIEDKHAIHKPSYTFDKGILSYDINKKDWICIQQNSIDSTKLENNNNLKNASELQLGQSNNTIFVIDGTSSLNNLNIGQIDMNKYSTETYIIHFSSEYNSNITISGNYKISGDNILDAKARELWELDCIFILGICLIKCTNWGIL